MALGLRTVTSAIDGRLKEVESQDPDERECALEALGNIGSCKSAFVYHFSILGYTAYWLHFASRQLNNLIWSKHAPFSNVID